MIHRNNVCGPKLAGCIGTCAACGEGFAEGDYTILVPLGPGASEQQRRKCAEGLPYNAVAVEVHWECAFGEPYLT